MRTIQKYQMEQGTPLVISGGARLMVRYVSVEPGGGTSLPCVWVEIDLDDENLPEEDLSLVYIGDGEAVPDGVHVGSCMGMGSNVYHVFSTREIHED